MRGVLQSTFPRYRFRVTPASSLRMLHLGLGAFHRAHQAAYMQRLLDAGERRWTLVAGNIRPESDGSVEALSAQGGAYTLETVTPSGERSYRRITAISAVVPWQPRLPALIELGAAPE